MNNKLKSNKVLSYFNNIAKFYDTKITAGSMGLNYIDKVEMDSLISNFPIIHRNRILDIGAGTGRITEQIVKSDATILALDISPEMLFIARKKIYEVYGNVYFVIASAEKLPIRNKTFDKIISVRVIHYVNNWKNSLSEISRVITRNGLILISTNNSFSFSILAKILGLMKVNVFNPFNFAEELRNQGFITVKIKSYIHIPILFYAISNNSFMLKFVITIDNIFGFLTKSLLGIRFYIVAKKYR